MWWSRAEKKGEGGKVKRGREEGRWASFEVSGESVPSLISPEL